MGQVCRPQIPSNGAYWCWYIQSEPRVNRQPIETTKRSNEASEQVRNIIADAVAEAMSPTNDNLQVSIDITNAEVTTTLFTIDRDKGDVGWDEGTTSEDHARCSDRQWQKQQVQSSTIWRPVSMGWRQKWQTCIHLLDQGQINGACILLKCLVNTKVPIPLKSLINIHESIAPMETSILEIEEYTAGSDATQPPVWEYLVMTRTWPRGYMRCLVHCCDYFQSCFSRYRFTWYKLAGFRWSRGQENYSEIVLGQFKYLRISAFRAECSVSRWLCTLQHLNKTQYEWIGDSVKVKHPWSPWTSIEHVAYHRRSRVRPFRAVHMLVLTSPIEKIKVWSIDESWWRLAINGQTSKLTIPRTLKPASTVTPFPIPKSTKINLENNMKAKAKAEREKSFPAKREAA